MVQQSKPVIAMEHMAAGRGGRKTRPIALAVVSLQLLLLACHRVDDLPMEQPEPSAASSWGLAQDLADGLANVEAMPADSSVPWRIQRLDSYDSLRASFILDSQRSFEVDVESVPYFDRGPDPPRDTWFVRGATGPDYMVYLPSKGTRIRVRSPYPFAPEPFRSDFRYSATFYVPGTVSWDELVEILSYRVAILNAVSSLYEQP